jgi:hypothetical protein
MWDDTSVRVVDATEPCVLERVGDDYYMLSDVSDDFKANFAWKRHDWSTLSKELVDTCVEGLIVEVDLCQYKIPRDLSCTLKKVGENYCDANGSVHDVKRVPDDVDLIDVDMEGNFIKDRPDRVYPDSAQQIDVIRRCASTVEDVLRTFPLERVGFSNIPSAVSVSECSVSNEFNVSRAVPIPKYYGDTSGALRRSEFIKILFNSCRKRGKELISVREINVAVLANNYFVKDGNLYHLCYTPKRPYHSCGISNSPIPGYALLVLPPYSLSQELIPFFFYHGVVLLFYDPFKYAYQDDPQFRENF